MCRTIEQRNAALRKRLSIKSHENISLSVHSLALSVTAMHSSAGKKGADPPQNESYHRRRFVSCGSLEEVHWLKLEVEGF